MVETKFTASISGIGFSKKKQSRATIDRPRSFRKGGDGRWGAVFDETRRIWLPFFPVEVHRQKVTGLVLQNGIEAHDKIEAPIVMPRKMPADHFVSDLKKAAVRTIRAFDPRFLADATNPFICTCRRITGFPGLPALEATRINILPAPEKRPKKLYLCRGWTPVFDNTESFI